MFTRHIATPNATNKFIPTMEQINMFDLVNQPPNRTKLSIVISFHLWICICARRFERAATFCSFIRLKLPQQRWRVLWLLLSIFVLICLHACICSLKCLSNNWKIYDKTWWAWWFFATTTTTAADAVISLLSLLSCQYVIVSLFSSGSCHSFLFVRLLWFESGENVWVFSLFSFLLFFIFSSVGTNAHSWLYK